MEINLLPTLGIVIGGSIFLVGLFYLKFFAISTDVISPEQRQENIAAIKKAGEKPGGICLFALMACEMQITFKEKRRRIRLFIEVMLLGLLLIVAVVKYSPPG